MGPFTPLILAGGLGTRLRPALADRPKVLALVNGRPFLSYLLDQQVDAGMREVVLCIGHLGELVVQAFGDAYRGMVVRYSKESKPLGTGGALRHALALVRSETILVMNGDSYCDIDLKSFIDWHIEKRFGASFVLAKVDDVGRYGSVGIDGDGRVLSFEEKSTNRGLGWINAGIYLFERATLSSMPEGGSISLEREVLPRLVKKGFYGCCCHGEFIDIGTPESYRLAGEFFGGARV